MIKAFALLFIPRIREYFEDWKPPNVHFLRMKKEQPIKTHQVSVKKNLSKPGILLAGLALVLASCARPEKTSRDVNPVVYIHRYDSVSYAVRVNQVKMVEVGHHPIPKEREDYYPVWFLIPDTIGTFTGNQIGTAYRYLSDESIIRNDGFPSEKIEISGGFINFSGMANVDAKGRFKYELRSFDPCAKKDCSGDEILLPIPVQPVQ
jgi:hypothetical protein